MQATQVVPQAYRILPELWLTVTGVLIMLIEPLMPPGMTRKPIGILALVGVIGALVASIWQLGLPAGTAYFGTRTMHVLLGVPMRVLVAILRDARRRAPDDESFVCSYGLMVRSREAASRTMHVLLGVPMRVLVAILRDAGRRAPDDESFVCSYGLMVRSREAASRTMHHKGKGCLSVSLSE